jgi:plasmid replication initiation protein
MLTMVRKADEDFQTYRIYLKDVIKEYGLENNKDAYERLRAGGFKLMRKIVKVVRNTEEGLMELNTPIVVGVENLVNNEAEDAKFIDVSFHPKMKPFLLSLQSHFTIYDVRNILSLPSSYSIRIYELLKQYQTIGRRKFLLKELKEIIGVIEEIDVNGKKKYKDNYPLYGNFKQRVLKKAQRDLKKNTDIFFTFEEIKRGRAVNELLFYIHANVPILEEIKETPSEPQDELTIKIYQKVKKWVSLDVVRTWVESYPEKQIKTGVAYTLRQLEEGKAIPNVGGYLQTMVKQENLVDPIDEKRKQALAKKQQQQAVAQKKEELDASLKMLYIRIQEKESEVIENILASNPDAQDEAIDVVSTSRFAHYDKSISLEENLKNPLAMASYRNAIKKLYPSQFEAIDEAYAPRVQALKAELARL